MAVILLALAILAEDVITMTSNHYVSIRGQRLNRVTCSSGGGMTGGYSQEIIKSYTGKRKRQLLENLPR